MWKVDWFQSTSTSCKFIENWLPIFVFVYLSAHCLWATLTSPLAFPLTSFVLRASCWYRPHILMNILCPLFACVIKCTRKLALCITVTPNQTRMYAVPSTWILDRSVFKVYLLASPSWWVIALLIAATSHFPIGYYCLWCSVCMRASSDSVHHEA